MINFRQPLFIAILLTYIVSAVLYALLTPNWQSPDEPAHYNYVRYLATKGEAPELVSGCYDQSYLNILTTRRFPPELPIDNICYEFHQPPLYYGLTVPIFKIRHGSLRWLRLFSISLGAGVVILAFFIARTIFPNRPEVIYGTMSFVAFVPMHVSMLASVNNDALASLILATMLFLLIRHLQEQKNEFLIAGLLGLGLLTKVTIYIVVPLVGVVYLFLKPKNWANLKRLSFIYSLALMIALPWYIRNAILYGKFDILGLIRHNEVVVGQLRPTELIAEIGGMAYLNNFVTTTFHSFWGQFGWMAVPMDSRVYLLLTLLTMMAVGGLGLFYWSEAFKLSSLERARLGLLACLILFMALAYGGYNWQFVQFQGRYLFPSIIPLGLFFSIGLSESLRYQRRWWLIGGLSMMLFWVTGNSILSGQLDKWAVLIVGLPLTIIIGRSLLARTMMIPSTWLLFACYLFLGGLTLACPFWFIVPNLVPNG